ncbi:MAG: hypothetical protein ABGX22_17585, partial [Pirellulaceae bacterium]
DEARIISDEAVGSGLRQEPWNGATTLEDVHTPNLLPRSTSPKPPENDHTPVGRRPDEGPDLQAPIRAETPQNSRRQLVRSVSHERPVVDSSNPLRSASFAKPSLR